MLYRKQDELKSPRIEFQVLKPDYTYAMILFSDARILYRLIKMLFLCRFFPKREPSSNTSYEIFKHFAAEGGHPRDNCSKTKLGKRKKQHNIVLKRNIIELFKLAEIV